jgi:hypothetical protein
MINFHMRYRSYYKPNRVLIYYIDSGQIIRKEKTKYFEIYQKTRKSRSLIHFE